MYCMALTPFSISHSADFWVQLLVFEVRAKLLDADLNKRKQLLSPPYFTDYAISTIQPILIGMQK